MAPSTKAASSARSTSPASRGTGCRDDSDTAFGPLKLRRSTLRDGGFGLAHQILADGLLPLGVDVASRLLERLLFGLGQRHHLDPVRLDLVDQAGVLGSQAFARHGDFLDRRLL